MTEKEDWQMNENVEEEARKKRELQELKIRKIVTSYLWKLGMPSNLKGYYYARDAITLVLLNPDQEYMMTKELYPEVGKKNRTTGERVERAIRSAVKVVWEKCDMEAVAEFIEEIFGNTIGSKSGRPTNSQFIAQIAEHIRIKDLI